MSLGAIGYSARADENKNPSEDKVAEETHCFTKTVCDAWDDKNNCTHSHEEKDCR